jgi:hypothetical protein
LDEIRLYGREHGVGASSVLIRSDVVVVVNRNVKNERDESLAALREPPSHSAPRGAALRDSFAEGEALTHLRVELVVYVDSFMPTNWSVEEARDTVETRAFDSTVSHVSPQTRSSFAVIPFSTIPEVTGTKRFIDVDSSHSDNHNKK